MYIHLGEDSIVNKKNIVGIFDFENTTISKLTREFLISETKKKEVVYVNEDFPKSFVLIREGKKTIIYITSLSSQTIIKRANAKFKL